MFDLFPYSVVLAAPEMRCALRAVECLEDSGDLEHDGTCLRVVHPLRAVQRVLQHVLKRCKAKKNMPQSHPTNNWHRLYCTKLKIQFKVALNTVACFATLHLIQNNKMI